MRGQQSIFADILPQIIKPKQDGIGRNKNLNSRRNSKLVHRYYYYVKLQPRPLTYDYVINTVASEFDLSETRLIVIIQQNEKQLKKLIAENPTKKDLEKLFPYLCWQ